MTDNKPMKDSRLPPVTQINQGDTCEGCSWLVQGDKASTGEHKGLTSWGCRFYHTSLGFHKEIPTRLNHCDIDGRITQKLYNKKRNQNDESKV